VVKKNILEGLSLCRKAKDLINIGRANSHIDRVLELFSVMDFKEEIHKTEIE
jgi:hypothetical protein